MWPYGAVERTFRDIIGKEVTVFGIDFRQIIPVIVRGTEAQTVAACINRDIVWRHMKSMHLVEKHACSSFGGEWYGCGDG